MRMPCIFDLMQDRIWIQLRASTWRWQRSIYRQLSWDENTVHRFHLRVDASSKMESTCWFHHQYLWRWNRWRCQRWKRWECRPSFPSSSCLLELMLQHGRFWENRSQPGDCYSRWAAPCLVFFTWNHLCPSISKNHDVQYHSLSWGRRTFSSKRSCLWLSCGDGAWEDGWIEHLSGFALDVWLITWFTLTSWAI